SLTLASATSRIGGRFFVEPPLRIRFLENGKDFHRCFLDVIKHPYFVYSQAILRPIHSAQTLYTTLAHLGRFVPQMNFKSVTNLPPVACVQIFVRLSRIRSQNDHVSHSGYSMARLYASRKCRKKEKPAPEILSWSRESEIRSSD